VPAVLYGHKEDVVSLALPAVEFEALLRAGARMVDLDLGVGPQKALIKDVQFDALGQDILHVDFVRVALDETVEVTVPIETHGTAAGVKEGGSLDLILHEVTVTCLPQAIPEAIRVRVDDLEIGERLHLREVPLPPGVTAVGDPEATVVTVHPPLVAAEEVPAEEAASAAPEVIGKEQPEEGSEAADQGKSEAKGR